MRTLLVLLFTTLVATTAHAQASLESAIAPLALRVDAQLGGMFGGTSGVRLGLSPSLRYRFLQAGIGLHAGGALVNDSQAGMSFDAGIATEASTLRWDLVGRLGVTRYVDVDRDSGLGCISCEGPQFPGASATLPFVGFRTAVLFNLARFTRHSVWLGTFAGWEFDLAERTVQHDFDYVDNKRVNGKTKVGGWSNGSIGVSASMSFDLGEAIEQQSNPE